MLKLYLGPRCSRVGKVDGGCRCACRRSQEEILCFKTGGSSGFCAWRPQRSFCGQWQGVGSRLACFADDAPAALIEKYMMEDLQGATVTPGQPTPALSSRAWVEHRSRIGGFKTSAHSSWNMAGALDCLFKGDVPGCRASLNLGLLQLDQMAIDRGNWVLASDLALEPPPPFAALAQHVLPDPARGDLPFSRLLDPRWAESSVAHLQDTDTYLTKRKNLGRSTLETAKETSDAFPKRKAKAKPKQKPEKALRKEARTSAPACSSRSPSSSR